MPNADGIFMGIQGVWRWYIGTFEEFAQKELADIVKIEIEDFDEFLRKFLSKLNYVKLLCHSLRGILFLV